MNVQRIGLIGLTTALLWGCDRSPAPVVQAPAPQGRRVVEFTPIAQLPLKQNVHVAVDQLGNVIYCAETDSGQDAAVIVGDSGIPRTTQLTSANILAAMGERSGGNGTIQSLTADPDGGILFFFNGGKGISVRTCIGRYFPQGDSISILFETKQLTTASGMGESIALARGQLIPMGQRMFVFLRHSDAWALLGFRLKAPPPTESPRQLSRILEKIRADDEDLDLTRPRYDLAPGPTGTDHVSPNMLLVDLTSGELWQIDPETGKGQLPTYLAGLPRELSRPVVLKDNRLLFFAADSEPILSDSIDVRPRLPHTSYPAMVEISGNDFTAIGREDLRAPSGFPAYAMRIHELCPAPDGSYVGADLSSGQLMRIHFTTLNSR